MGNRLVSSSPRHGIPRDFVAEEKARKHYENRATNRPKQIWDGYGWSKVASDKRMAELRAVSSN
jgi:hypothetical protein